MSFTTADKNNQEHLSTAARQFLDYVEQHPRLLERSTFEPFFTSAREHAKVLSADPKERYALQPWPVLITEERDREFERAGVGLTRIHRSMHQRLFGKDRKAITKFYGLESEMVAALLLSKPSDVEINLSRADFVDTTEGLKCIEVNFGSLGGWQEPTFAPVFLDNPEIAGFLDAHDLTLTYRNSIRALMRHVVTDCLNSPLVKDGELNVLIVGSDGGATSVDCHPREVYQQEFEAVLAEMGNPLQGVVEVARKSDIVIKKKAVRVRGRRFHAAIEQDDKYSNLLAAFKGRYVRLYSGPVGMILGDKRNLAILSERAETDFVTDEERELIRKYIPWTRRMDLEEVTYGDETVPMNELLTSERQNLVIKAGESFGGKDVRVGRRLDDEAWRQAIEEARTEGGWIVQEFLEARPYSFQAGDSGACPHDVEWSLFVFGEEYAGCRVRMAPKTEGSLLNVSQGARIGIVFTAAES